MSQFKELINSEQPVLVDFFAEWCGPCKTMAPILHDVVSKLNGKAKIIKVDIDKNPGAAKAFNVRSVPTLILFKKGEIKWQQSGVVQGRELLSVIEKHL
jgi:thioredoxin 1